MRDNLPATRDTRIKNIIKKINKQTKEHKILDQLKKKILTGKKIIDRPKKIIDTRKQISKDQYLHLAWWNDIWACYPETES